MPTSIPLTVTNNTGVTDAFMAIIGLDANGLWAYVNPDGSITEFSTTAQNNYIIPIGVGGVTVNLPQLASGQVYFSVNSALVIGTNADPGQPGGVGLVLPAGWAAGNPNQDIQYDVIEFTLNDGGMNCDLTQVDAFGLPISMELIGDITQKAGGWNKSMAEIFKIFHRNPLLAPLVTSGIRIINPSHGIENGVFPADYLDAAISAGWNSYIETPLNINISGGSFAGNYLGTVSGTNGTMVITLDGNSVGTIDYPGTLEALFCNGVFDQGNTAMGAVANVVATAINRGILAINPQPDCQVQDFYHSDVAHNPYAKLLHELASNGLCYAFAYDDQCGQSSDLADGNPTAWNVTLESLA